MCWRLLAREKGGGFGCRKGRKGVGGGRRRRCVARVRVRSGVWLDERGGGVECRGGGWVRVGARKLGSNRKIGPNDAAKPELR